MSASTPVRRQVQAGNSQSSGDLKPTVEGVSRKEFGEELPPFVSSFSFSTAAITFTAKEVCFHVCFHKGFYSSIKIKIQNQYCNNRDEERIPAQLLEFDAAVMKLQE